MKNKIKKLLKLWNKKEFNFEIHAFWDGQLNFYFGDGLNGYKSIESFKEDENGFEKGIDWLIKKYNGLKVTANT